MKIEIPIETLRERRLFLATPMYGGQAHAEYVKSLCDLTGWCARQDVGLRTYFVSGEALLPMTRARMVAEFMRSDCTHLLFVDADIGFDPLDAVALLALASAESPYDVLAGPFPRKEIAWAQVVRAVESGAIGENPSDAERFAHTYAFNPLPGQTAAVRLDAPVEVQEVGTGFTLVRREAFGLIDRHRAVPRFVPDGADESLDPGGGIPMYFDCEIEPATRRYLSEAYSFCRKLRQAGGRIWLCPWMKLRHVGNHVHRGDLVAQARLDLGQIA